MFVGIFWSHIGAYPLQSLLFWVLQHHARIRSFLFWVLRHRARIRSLLFRVLRHRAQIRSLLFRVLRHRAWIWSLLFWVLQHRIRIRSLLFRVLRIMPEFDPSCFGFSDIVPRFDPSGFGFFGIMPGFDPFYFRFSDIVSGFDPFCYGFSGIVPGFDPVVLGSLVLARIWSLISRSLRYSPGYDSFFGTCLDPTLFRDSPGFYLFDTHPDLTHFLVLTRIHSLVLRILRYSLGYDPSFWLLWYLPRPFSSTFPALFSILSRIRFPILSDIASGSPLLSLAACRDLLCFSGIVLGSLIFSGIASDFLLPSPASCPIFSYLL